MVHKSSSRPYRDIWANFPLSASRRSVGATCVLLQEGVGLSREAEQSPEANKDSTPARGHLSTPDNAGIPQLPPKNCECTSRGSPCLQGLAIGSGPRHTAQLQGGLGSETPSWGQHRHSGGYREPVCWGSLRTRPTFGPPSQKAGLPASHPSSRLPRPTGTCQTHRKPLAPRLVSASA